MGLKMSLIIGMSIAISPSELVAQVNVSEAAANWASVAQCADLTSASARHDCVDAVLRRTGVLDDQKLAQAARNEFGTEGRPRERGGVSTVQAVTGSASASAEVSAPPSQSAGPARAQDIERLITTVTSFISVGYNRLSVTTAEGSVWEQTQAEAFTSDPRRGDRFVIERGAIGGFRCQFREASLYRCKRVD